MPATAPLRLRAPVSVETGSLELDITHLIPWAKGIARGVRADYGFLAGSQEELELEGVALEVLVERSHRFDETRLPPEGDLYALFRASAGAEIRSRCRREVIRLKNAGTFRTASSKNARTVQVEGLPVARHADGSTELLLESREAGDADEPEWEELAVEKRASLMPPKAPKVTSGSREGWKRFLAQRQSCGVKPGG